MRCASDFSVFDCSSVLSPSTFSPSSLRRFLVWPLAAHVPQQARRGFPERGARNHVVDLALLQQELGGLEALGEVLADGLLDDPLTSESHHRTRFRQNHIALHGEGG